ncbi:MAG: ammonium transporter, partial [Deltaproteobacteria bacterium]|nr:ammonium transporter [Deltaproteobacteria bacterium]
VSVHGVCGAFGTLLVAFFAAPGYGTEAVGLFYGGGFSLLIPQLVGVVAIGAWAFGGGLVVFSVVRALCGIRVSAATEIRGLDVTEHKAEAYTEFQFFTSN